MILEYGPHGRNRWILTRSGKAIAEVKLTKRMFIATPLKKLSKAESGALDSMLQDLRRDAAGLPAGGSIEARLQIIDDLLNELAGDLEDSGRAAEALVVDQAARPLENFRERLAALRETTSSEIRAA